MVVMGSLGTMVGGTGKPWGAMGTIGIYWDLGRHGAKRGCASEHEGKPLSCYMEIQPYIRKSSRS